MSISREDHQRIADIVADAVNAGYDKLRADIFARMLELRSPNWSITPKGEVFIDGQLAGDIRPVFESISPRIAQDVLAALEHKPRGDNDDGR